MINDITLTFFPLGVESVKNMFSKALGTKYGVCYVDDFKDSLYKYYVQQYNASETRFILFSPQSNPHTTILFANILDGYVNLIRNVSESCNLEYYTIRISDGLSLFMQAYHFHHYAQTGERHILCYQDPKWVFYEEGQTLWFENTEYYTQRLKKNRLNKEIIMTYLAKLGWNIERDEFWLPQNGLFEFNKQ